MKKYLSLLCTAMLCACCLALAACGGSSGASTAASGSAASGSAASVAVDPAEKFIGDWKFAALEYQGMTMTGDLSAILESDELMTLSIKGDGTSSVSINGEAAEATWEQKDDNTITLTATAEGETRSFDIAYADGVLSMDMSDEEIQGKALFTADGVLQGAKEISTANATPITSAADLEGEWKLCGINMMGVSMYGDAESIAAVAGDSGTETNIAFSADKATFGGQDMSYTVDENGAAISESGITMPIMKLDDSTIIIDMSAIGMDMVMAFSK